MSRNSIQDSLQLSVKDTLGSTLRAPLGVVNTGLGTTLSLTCDEATNTCTIAGLKDAVDSLGLSMEDILSVAHSGAQKDSDTKSPITCVGHGYIQLSFSLDLITCFELQDLLIGLNWTLLNYTVSPTLDSKAVHHQVWVQRDVNNTL